ncbi:MAG: hypothetical protein M1837_002354 [Sclerophora amabilis]|nr:MAG: hypothetical protein M1837_002354 [Sclerophora amabilis]
MATEGSSENVVGSNTNGGGFNGENGVTTADALRKKHEAEEAHRATIEDVVDEEDIVHPPPSSAVAHATRSAAPAAPQSAPLSAKAAGKQRAQEDVPVEREAAPNNAGATKAPLDTHSHDLFPSLGAGSQPARTSRPVATAWGAKKPASISNATNGHLSNGPNGHGVNGTNTTSSNQSSRASTPASGLATPSYPTTTSTLAGNALPQRGPLPQSMSIPGKYTERISLFPPEMKPRHQLKKPVPDVLREINRKSKANVQMSSGAGGAYHFDAKGPVEAVRQALKDVAKELGSKQSTKVTVPASIRPHIIGRQGAIVQGISQRTGARIQVPRPDEASASMEEEDDAVIDVLIEGDSVAAEMARREIESIVNERTSTVNTRLREIPAEFYPFLAGPRKSRVSALEDGKDLRVQIPHYYTWSSQPPPQVPQPDEAPIFAPATGNLIHLSGDRLAVQEARAEIERHVAALRKQVTLSQIDINKGQHQFVVGEKGSSLHDILEDTGCTVLLPPGSHDSETLTIVGPPDRIEQGIDKVMELATSMQMTLVDISRQHPKAPQGAAAHARNLTTYLKHRREIERLERLYDAHIALPKWEDSPASWEIYSRDGKNNIRARTEIINMVNGLPPSRLSPLDVEPFYHQHLHERSADQLKADYGVRLILPEGGADSPQMLLVYEGLGGEGADVQLPRQPPSSAQVKESEKALQEARQHLLSMIAGQQDIIGRSIEAPKKFHDKVRKFAEKERQLRLGAGEIPVHVQVGEPRMIPGETPRSQTPIAAAALDNEVILRGPINSVNDLATKLLQFVEEEREYERERGYTTTFDYPQKFANHLIGKKGENVRKYREDYDVEIQVNDGKVEIKGPKVKAEAAKASILTLGKKLQDETTHVLKVQPQYHKDLIGGKGSQVNRLQDRYGVRVNFPRSATPVPLNDDQSVADTVSDSGAGRPNGKSNQAPDEVIIRGPRKGADEAREELLNLLRWTIDNSHAATVSVAQSQVPSLIGQGGREMDNMRVTTGAQIDVPDMKREGSEPTDRVDIRIKGTKKQVEDAKSLLQGRAKVFDDRITQTLNVDKKHHRALIGGGGSNIRDIVIKAGGPDDRRELARMVRFPRQDSEENVIRVEGSKAVVEKIVASIDEIIKQRETQVTAKVDVDPGQHRLLIGRNGETRRNLESQFRVNIEIPKQGQSAGADSGVTVVGQPADVEKAKTHILSLVKDRQGETVQVPRSVHHSVSDNGQFFRRLRNEHKVLVDHAGHHPPNRKAPASATPRERVNGGALPLITDEPDSLDNFSWEILDHELSNEQGEIPWILRGPPDNVTQARAVLEAAIQQAQQQTSTGYLILPDPRTYRFVIGPGGSQVNAIRKQTGCRVTVPRDQAKGEAIEIQGSRDGVSEAKDIILEVVRNGGNGNGNNHNHGRRESRS